MKEMKEMKDLQSDLPKESFTKSILSGQTHGKPLCVTDSNSPTSLAKEMGPNLEVSPETLNMEIRSAVEMTSLE